jgi:hypothetical protein
LYLLSWIKDATSAGNYRENEAGYIARSPRLFGFSVEAEAREQIEQSVFNRT